MQLRDKCTCKEQYAICQVHLRMHPELSLLPEIRCERTGNIAGTDCWRLGHPCKCEACTALVALLNSGERK